MDAFQLQHICSHAWTGSCIFKGNEAAVNCTQLAALAV